MTVKAYPPEFYDSLAHRSEASRSRYLPLYRAALGLIPAGARIVELGCGTGGFASLAIAAGHPYTGIDFSPEAVKIARRNARGGHFVIDDLRSCALPDGDAYVSLEVLEHLDDDLGLILRLPQASTVVLSVPSFDSESHLRWFSARGDARERFEWVLDIDHEEFIPLPRGRFFHLIRGAAA